MSLKAEIHLRELPRNAKLESFYGLRSMSSFPYQEVSGGRRASTEETSPLAAVSPEGATAP